jgi:protein-disulfide isomerase
MKTQITLSRIGAGVLAAASLAVLAACGGSNKAVEGDMALGAPEGAKVTVIEYASPTCPHCAAWQKETWPGFEEKYVKTNKVRFVFREIPTPPADIATAGVLLARCAGEDKYFDVMHELMASQSEWMSGAIAPRASLLKTANAFGMNEQQFTTCITDEKAIAALEKRVQAASAAGVTGTPYFTVNGKNVVTPGGEGASLADLSAAIDAELAK